MSIISHIKNNQNCVTIKALVAKNAENDPSAIVLLAQNRPPLKYSELNTHIRYVSKTLNQMGFGPPDRIAIVLPNGPEMASAFIAVSATATCTPLNPNYKESEYEFYLSDLGCKAVIVGKNLESPIRAAANKLKIPIIEMSFHLDDPAGIFSLSNVKTAKTFVQRDANLEDVALILHTSGTTSRPKIVPLTQANLCASAQNIRKTLNLTSADRCLNIMPLFHIHGLIGACLSSIAAGASLVCTPGYESEQFFGWLKDFRPTWYSAVPTMHQSILSNAPKHEKVTTRTSLRFIRSSSSSLPPQTMNELEGIFNVPVIEAYGMSEASHQMCSNPHPPQKRKAGSVGLPTGQKVAIMDEDGNLLSKGSTGEIVIKGDNVTIGYENNPEANKSAFTNGWFRTGDQGYVDNDGYVYISGRLKEIINRGGEKISPREIDEVLLDHPSIAQAVTFGVPHKRLGEDLAVAVVLNHNPSVTEQDIREYAFSKLADHKVPSQILFVEEVPKGPTGKLQRIGLHKKLSPLLKCEYVAPRNPVEKELSKIWCEVLELTQIGVYDNFFWLGGDSLLATGVAARIRAIFAVEFPLITIFREPTISNGAHVIERHITEQVAGLTDEEALDLLDNQNIH